MRRLMLWGNRLPFRLLCELAGCCCRRRQRPCEGQQLLAHQEGPQRRWHRHARLRLVVLQKARERALRGCQRCIEHVGVRRLRISRQPDACVQAARLVVGAVGARHKLAECAAVREPALQVVLFGRRVVERA
eukprot:357516-Chlamydomonas_euryale.AAC.26